jgi:hypothetical protein
MPINYRNAPPDAIEVLKTELEQMTSKRAFGTPRLHNAITKKAEVPLLEHALPVYQLGLYDIAKNQDIKAAIQTGWRYPLKLNNEIIAHAETIIDPSGKNLFSSINEGPVVEGTTKAIKTVEKQNEIMNGNFEVRLLFIPALNIAALWLVDKEGKADFALPIIEPVPESLTLNKRTPLKDFLTVVHEKAKSLEPQLVKEAIGA